MVQRKTPPKATSSPNTTAFSSFNNAMLDNRMSQRRDRQNMINPVLEGLRRSKPQKTMGSPHRVSDCLIEVHLPAFSPSDERCTVHPRIVIVLPCYTWSAQGRVASGKEDRRSGDGRQGSSRGRWLRHCGIEPAAESSNLLVLTVSTASRKYEKNTDIG